MSTALFVTGFDGATELPRPALSADNTVLVALCLHEAAHAAVAERLGLVVEEVSITGTIESDELTERLYGIPAGTTLPGAGTRIPDRFMDSHPEEVLVAMAAPSCIETGVAIIDAYSTMEAELAVGLASQHGFDAHHVLDRAKAAVEEAAWRILEVAAILAIDGTWSADVEDAREVFV